MEFPQKERSVPHLMDWYSTEDLEIARSFAKKAVREFGSFLKSVVLFGSVARGKKNENGDIDILIVINDLNIYISSDVSASYKIIVSKLVKDTSPRIHVTTLRLTTFWDYVRLGDPVAINILRDGIALVDTGFFDPIQLLLYQGKIRPTYESIWNYYTRAPTTLANSKWHVLQAVMDLYWAVIDSAHAVLMKVGEIPPSPSHVSGLLEAKLCKKKLLPKKCAKTMNTFYTLSKKISHREISYISGSQFDKLHSQAEDFVKTMRKFLEK